MSKQPKVVIPTKEELDKAAAEEQAKLAADTAKAAAGDVAPDTVDPAKDAATDLAPPDAPPPTFDLDGFLLALDAAKTREEFEELLKGVPHGTSLGENGALLVDRKYAAFKAEAETPVRGEDRKATYRVEKSGAPRLDGHPIYFTAGQEVQLTDREVELVTKQGLPLLPIVDPNDPVEQLAKAGYELERAAHLARGTGYMPDWFTAPEAEKDRARSMAKRMIDSDYGPPARGSEGA